MAKNIVLDSFFKKILGNGEKLTLQEIMALARFNFSRECYNEKQIYNFLYNMKKRGEVKQNSEGKYYIANDMMDFEDISQPEDVGDMELNDYSDFEIINPITHRKIKEVLSVMDTGIIAANSLLLRHFDNLCAELRLKKDCTEIIMIKNGKYKTKLSKQGRTKCYNLVEKLKKANMRFPLYYVGEWDEEQGIWHGKYFPYNPNRKLKEKVKQNI